MEVKKIRLTIWVKELDYISHLMKANHFHKASGSDHRFEQTEYLRTQTCGALLAW
jgi:hypothetical protein